MSYSPIKKWFFGSFVGLFVIAVLVIAYFYNEVNHVMGANTQVVDASQFVTISGGIAITNVSVLSRDSNSMLANQTVLINGNRIESLGNVGVPSGYRVINGAGQYLIPGLVDSHVHIKKSKNDLLLYLANGITHIAEMTGSSEHFELRKGIQQGDLGPDIYISSPKITSQEGLRATFRSWFEGRHQNFSSALEGREAVRKFHSQGYDSIKISSDLEAEIYFAINDEAKKLGIPVIGHIPNGIGLSEVYQSGQSQLAHVESITQAIRFDVDGMTASNREVFLEYFKRNSDDIALKLKGSNIVISSTLWLHETLPLQDFDLAGFLESIELEYQNPGWVEGSAISRGWLPGNSSYENPGNTDPTSKRESEVYWDTNLEAQQIVLKALARHGVKIMAGTDSNGADGVIAGFSLHNELEALSRAGLSNAQVLHAATLAPSEWMQSHSGVIEVGYDANLVLLAENPLDEIGNTRTIQAVVSRGKLLERQELDKILRAVKDANNRSRQVSIGEFL